MLNVIWIVMIVASVVYSFFVGTAQAVSDAVFSGAQECVSFVLKIGAFMIMWSGFMSIADESRLTDKTARLLSPFICRIFPGVDKKSSEAKLIASNMTANMLGLSNAATPVGIEAMKKLAKRSKNGKATNDMCLLAVINSASIQLVPTTLIAMRSSFGSSNPTDIVLPIWIVSGVTLIFAIAVTSFFAGKE